MKKMIITITSILAGAALVIFGMLVFAGKISFSMADETAVTDCTAAAYIEYMDMYLIVNNDGIMIQSSLSEPESDIPEITGLVLGNVVTGKTLETSDQEAFEYALNVVAELNKNCISEINEVYISSDGEITIYAKEIKILLGEDEDTSEKINDLKDFYYTVVEMEGTLDMQEVSESSTGYTFKVSSS